MSISIYNDDLSLRLVASTNYGSIMAGIYYLPKDDIELKIVVDTLVLKVRKNIYKVIYSDVAVPSSASASTLADVINGYIFSNEHNIITPGLPSSTVEHKQYEKYFHTDSYGHSSVAPVHTVFDSALVNDKRPQSWTESTYGTFTYNAGNSSKDIKNISGTSGRAISQTRIYQLYQPGKMSTIMTTAVLSVEGSQTDIIHRMGLFDNGVDKTQDDVKSGDGHYFGYDNTGLFICERSYRTGSQVDTIVRQSDFNTDVGDGTGMSGYTFDPQKVNIFFISYQWLGAGSVWMGLIVDGQKVPFHHWRHSNLYDNPYIGRAALPIRFEVESTNNTTNIGTTRQICSSTQVSGGYDIRGNVFSVDNGITKIAIDNTNERMVLAIRKKSSHVRVILNIISIQFLCASDAHVTVIAFPGEVGTTPFSAVTPVWASLNNFSGLEYTTTAGVNVDTANGAIIHSAYYNGKGDSVINEVGSRNLFGSDIAGNSDMIVITAKVFSGSDNVSCACQVLETP